MLTRIDQIQAVICRERSSVSEIVNEMYQQNCREILQSYQKAGCEIDAVYQELLEVVERMRRNVKQLETDLQVQLSPQTKSLFHICWNNSEWDIPTVLDFRQETAKVVQGLTVTTATEVVELWGCKNECRTCLLKAKELELLANNYQSVWVCPLCTFENPKGKDICQMCYFGKSQPRLVLTKPLSKR